MLPNMCFVRYKDSFGLLLAAISASAALAEPPALITSVNQVREMTADDFAKSAPFCLTGQIISKYSMGFASGCFLSTSDGNWSLEGTNVNLEVGQIVRVSGLSELGYFADDLFLRPTNAVVVGSAPIPEPKRLSAAEILDGKGDFAIVRLRGFVVDAFEDDIDRGYVIALLNADGHVFHLSAQKTKDCLDKLRALIDATVEITGVCSPIIGGKRRFSIPSIGIRSIENDIRVITPSPDDPFAAPELEYPQRTQISRFAAMRRRSVSGRVLAVWGGRHLLLADGKGHVSRINLAEGETLPKANDWIDAAGFPETDFFNINLTNARIRPAASRPAGEELPQATSADAISHHQDTGRFDYDYHGKAVRLRGIVRSTPGPGQTLSPMTIENDGILVLVDPGDNPDAFSGLQLGSEVEVTGVCLMEIATRGLHVNFPTVTGFSVVIRTPDDIRVITRPSWWTPGRAWSVFGLLAAALLAVCIWNTSLRRLAERRGHELLRRQIESVKSKLQVEERTRLAVELHDSLSQTLTGVSMEIAAADDLRGNAPPPMLAHLGIATRTLKSCRDELRNCLWDLRSQALEERDVSAAIRRTLQPHVSEANLTVRFNVPRARLSDSTAHALLRIIRELAVNAIRHGDATSVRIAGTIDGDRLLGSVTDNGKGFDPDLAPGVLQGHFGLQGIRERLEKLGGEFTIDSILGKGSKAVFTIPVPKEEQG